MSLSHDEFQAALARMATGSPQSQALGFRFISAGDGHGSIEVPWREDLVSDPDAGIIAGGVVTTLLDHTCGLAISSSGSSHISTATLDLRIDYMRPAAPRAGIIAAAHAYKLTRSVAFLRAQAWDVDPADPIATAQGAFILNRAPTA
jgi:uncharacterized protein (TIGR00369 family)